MKAPPDVLAVGYTNSRGRGYNTVKRFTLESNDQVWVTRKLVDAAPLADAAGPAVPGIPLLVHNLAPERYVRGRLLGSELERVVELDDWPAFLEHYNSWISFLYRHRKAPGEVANIFEAELPPEFADCVPQNIVLDGEDVHYIDREWELHGKITIGALVLRTVMSLYVDDSARSFVAEHLHARKAHHILYLLPQHLGYEVTQAVVENYIYVNNTISAFVFPEKPPIALSNAMQWFFAQDEERDSDAPDVHGGGRVKGQERPLTPWYKLTYWHVCRRLRRSARSVATMVRGWWA
jgi:hypothetical protein